MESVKKEKNSDSHDDAFTNQNKLFNLIQSNMTNNFGDFIFQTIQGL